NYRIEAQVTAGYGFSASGSAEYGNIEADHRSTTRQSGLFAGDGGFQVNVKEHTDLKGGIITATEAAEQNNRNRFQTATLSHSDIENHSRYQGESYGIGMSGGMSGENLGQSQNLGGVKLYNTGAAGSGGTAGGSPEGYSQSIGFGRDGDNRSSLTKSGIGTSNITIGNDTTGAQAQAVYTAVRTETAEQHSGRLNNTFDKERVQKELDIRREVTQQFGQNVQYANTEINKRLDSLKEQLETGRISQRDYDRRLANWQYGKLALNSLAAGLSAPTDSGLGIATATASPAAAYAVGQYFKGLAQENLLVGKTE
ncbi:hemagglutinin, partial [Neisseria dentiae]|nr:hemagglutinin [Neisseria dentiae]